MTVNNLTGGFVRYNPPIISEKLFKIQDLGISINAAVVPLHAWLVDAYPEGTVTGSVFLTLALYTHVSYNGCYALYQPCSIKYFGYRRFWNL